MRKHCKCVHAQTAETETTSDCEEKIKETFTVLQSSHEQHITLHTVHMLQCFNHHITHAVGQLQIYLVDNVSTLVYQQLVLVIM